MQLPGLAGVEFLQPLGPSLATPVELFERPEAQGAYDSSRALAGQTGSQLSPAFAVLGGHVADVPEETAEVAAGLAGRLQLLALGHRPLGVLSVLLEAASIPSGRRRIPPPETADATWQVPRLSPQAPLQWMPSRRMELRHDQLSDRLRLPCGRADSAREKSTLGRCNTCFSGRRRPDRVNFSARRFSRVR